MGWKLTWGDKSWTEADLMVEHVSAIMRIQGVDDWSFCNPTGGPMRLLGVLAAFVSVDTHTDVVELLAEMGTETSAVDLLAALSIEDEPSDEPDEPAAPRSRRKPKVTDPTEE